jgi:competence protein ComEC
MKVIQFPLSKIAFGFILGIISTYNWNISTESNSLGLVLSLVLFFIFYFVKKTTTKRTMTFGVTIYFVSFFLGGITLINNTDSFQKKHYLHYNSAFKSPQVITLIIREKLKSTKTNDRYIAVVQTINETQYNGKLILNITKDSSAAHINTGSYLKTKETLYRNREPNNPNQFDYGDYLNKKQLYAQLYTSATSIQFGTQTKKDIWFYTDQLRATIKQNLAKNKFSKKELNIAVALLMGQKQEIASDVMQDYQYAGAIHILSVSGLHVGYLLLFLTFLLKPIPNTKKGATIKLLITLLTLASFAVIAGLSPSVLRSVVMFSFVAVGYQLRRTVNIYHTLIVSALLILLFEPYFLFDVGFQLSYLALFFIVWFQPIIAPLFKPKSKIIAYCWTILSVSFAAQIGTLPLSIYYFHQFPGLFFITNLVVAPLLTFIMIIGIIVLFLASFGVTPTILTKPLEWGIYGLNSTVHFVASFEQFLIKDIPFNSFLLISSYATIVATIIWLKKLNFNKLMIVLCLIITMQSSQLYTKWTIQKEEEWIVLNSKKSSIVVERHGDKVAIFTNNQLKKSDFSTTLIKSYLVANYSQIGPKQKLPNLLYYKKNKIMIIDSSGVYLERSKPDILILTQSPKINLDRLLEKLHPKQVVADNSNYKNAQKRWELSCRKQKIPFHATAEKGFFKLN